MRSVNRAIIAALLPALLFATGCGARAKMASAAARAKAANDLKMIGLAYHNHINDKMKAPDKAEDLQPYLMDAADVYQALTGGRYVFIYGVKLTEMDPAAGMAGTVVGYDKDTPEQGGNVLMGDGSVQYKTPDEFKKLPQAKPKAKTP